MKTYIALSIFPQILIVRFIAKYPEHIEHYYSRGCYPVLAKGFRYAFGWVPFSVGDLFYSIAIILIIRFLILKGKLFFHQTRVFFREVFVVLSTVYFIFYLFWGLNYYRLPIHQSLKIEDEYTYEELIEFTERLIRKSNEVHLQIVSQDSLMVTIPHSRRKIYKMTQNGFNHLGKKVPQFKYQVLSLKSSLFSLPLTYMGYGGYLNPLTNEAQVNSVAFTYKYPTVSCHEQAHQIGYSAENEANFIGFLAAIHNDDIYFKYSGYIYGLRYCLGEIRSRNYEKFEELTNKINPGIIKNYIDVSNFWRKYENKAEPVFKSTFNAYLKANNQEGGIKSYSYVVALLVNYYKNRQL